MKAHIEPNDSGIPWSQQYMTAFTCEEGLKREEDNKCEEKNMLMLPLLIMLNSFQCLKPESLLI